MTEGSVDGSDGQGGTWRLAGIEQANASNGALPFFIDYRVDRSERWEMLYNQANHAAPPTGISWIGVSVDEDVLRHWLADADLPIRIVEGPPGLRTVGVGCQDRAVTVISEW
jgi:hypothetical protein